MKKAKKNILLVLCALLLAGGTILTTVAYLTDEDEVINTFTVGRLGITLDEAPVNEDGQTTDKAAERVTANKYHLVPGLTYEKDPTIHVEAGSEDAYIFVKVENGIAQFEAESGEAEGGYKTIAEQITANGWSALEGVENVFYRTYTQGDKSDMVVFTQFKIDGMADTVDGWDEVVADNAETEEDEATNKIVVTGYAVQKAGFGSAADAWNATFASGEGAGAPDYGTEITDSMVSGTSGFYGTYENGCWTYGTNWKPGQNTRFVYLGLNKLNAGDVVTVQLVGDVPENVSVKLWESRGSVICTALGNNTYQCTITGDTKGKNYQVETDKPANVKVWLKRAQ